MAYNRKFIWCTFHLFTILLMHKIRSYDMYEWQVFTSMFHMYFGGKFYEEKRFETWDPHIWRIPTFGHEIRGKSCGIYALDYGTHIYTYISSRTFSVATYLNIIRNIQMQIGLPELMSLFKSPLLLQAQMTPNVWWSVN